jgi:hypothetical protein
MIRPAVSKPQMKAAAPAPSKASGWLVAGIILGQAAGLAAGYAAAWGVASAQAAGTISLALLPEDQAAGGAAVAGLLFMGMIVGPQLFAGLAAYRRWKPALAAGGAIVAGGLIAWMWSISTFGQTFEGISTGVGIHAAWIAAGLIGAGLSLARRRIEA